MGLDMFLHAEKFVSGYEHSNPAEKKIYAKIQAIFGIPADHKLEAPSCTLRTCVAYWRKANAIHAWFVRNCQEGEDDGREGYVSRDKLTELKGLCEKVLADKDKAEKLLPTKDGFFFGSTDYGNAYFQDIEDTIKQLTWILETLDDDLSFYYRASW